jgi:hypothetical protein
MCFQREPGMAVPGCIGGEEEHSRTDFCVPDPSFSTALDNQPTDSPTKAPVFAAQTLPAATLAPVASPKTAAPIPATLKPTDAPTVTPLLEIDMVGNDGNPSSFFPLGMCRGDCDTDEEVSHVYYSYSLFITVLLFGLSFLTITATAAFVVRRQSDLFSPRWGRTSSRMSWRRR